MGRGTEKSRFGKIRFRLAGEVAVALGETSAGPGVDLGPLIADTVFGLEAQSDWVVNSPTQSNCNSPNERITCSEPSYAALFGSVRLGSVCRRRML
jgi:hypothetical protein